MRYLFTIRTNKEEYKEYNGMKCWVHSMIRDDGFIEVYVLNKGDLILLRPSELED